MEAATIDAGRRRFGPCACQWKLLRTAAVAVAFGGLQRLPCVLAEDSLESKPITDQDVMYIWPVTVWNLPLKNFGKDKGQGSEVSDEELVAHVADLAEKGYERYLHEVLPRELEIDTAFAEEFRVSDGSLEVRTGTEVNMGFLRWQKRVFSKRSRSPVEELNWDGKPVPKHPDISYDWDLYSDRYFNLLLRKVKQTAIKYLGSFGDRHEGKFRLFPWVEVYRKHDFQRPHVHTGAQCAATFFARSDAATGPKLVFEDVRGMNPPFGQRHEMAPVQGELVLHPSWASHYVAPNQGNTTHVFISFLFWPPNGAPDFDWEDDPSGDFIYKRKPKIKQAVRPKSAEPDPAQPHQQKNARPTKEEL